jgi:glycosyltransferase involved in cell wall biosynthesis
LFNPKVSIVIPVYKGSNYLREAIDSALAQTYKNIEVIVVNDGSNDGGKTEAIAKSYGDRIHYFYKENGGVATALNLGIHEMVGEYFSWLSHDDVYYPDKLEVQIDYLRRMGDKNVILYSDCDIIDQSSKKIRSHRVKHVEPEEFIFSLLNGYLINGCTALVPKICFDVVGLFNEDLKSTQDYEMWFRIGRKYKMIHIPNFLIQSRHHSEQGSVTMVSANMNEQNKFFVWYFKEISLELTDKLPSYILRTAIYLKRHGVLKASNYGYDLALTKISTNRYLLIRHLILIIRYRLCDSIFDLYYWLGNISRLKIYAKSIPRKLKATLTQ